MSTQYLIGVDLGTSGTKAALYKSDGTLVTQYAEEVPIYYPRPGVVEQENDDFYRTAANTVKKCVQESGIDPRAVAAIAFDSQMAGVGAVDEDFNPATRFDSWLDMRCQPYIEFMDREYGDLITRLTGCPPTCDHGPKILWWKEEEPAAYDRVTKFVMPAGYVAGKMVGLRGEDAFIDYTFIHFSGLSDAQNGQWSAECAAHSVSARTSCRASWNPGTSWAKSRTRWLTSSGWPQEPLWPPGAAIPPLARWAAASCVRGCFWTWPGRRPCSPVVLIRL